MRHFLARTLVREIIHFVKQSILVFQTCFPELSFEGQETPSEKNLLPSQLLFRS